MKKVNTVKIGENLRKIRKSYGYTQEGLAELIDCSTRYISDIEQNRKSPSYEILVRICNGFKIDMNDIFCEYLVHSEDKEVELDLVGYKNLGERDRRTIKHMIEFFNAKDNK